MRIIITVTVLLWVSATIWAKTVEVPSGYDTIQKAIDACDSGDTIIVYPGTYEENIVVNKSLNIRSDQGYAGTVIDGGSPVNPDEGSVITISGFVATDTVIDGFTIKNGSGRIDAAAGSRCGGGVYIYQSNPEIINNYSLFSRICGSNHTLGASP